MVSTIPLTFAAETKFTTLAIYSPKSYFNSMKKFFHFPLPRDGWHQLLCSRFSVNRESHPSALRSSVY